MHAGKVLSVQNLQFCSNQVTAIPTYSRARVAFITTWRDPGSKKFEHVNRCMSSGDPLFANLLIDTGGLLRLFTKWVPDEGLRRKILVENPAQLYGFGEA